MIRRLDSVALDDLRARFSFPASPPKAGGSQASPGASIASAEASGSRTQGGRVAALLGRLRTQKRALFAAAIVVAGAVWIPPTALAAAQPTISAAWVTSVTSTSATLHATVNPEGEATGYRFEYLTEAKYQANGETFAGASRAPTFGEEELGSEETAQPATQHLTGLTPATAYRYRILATNGAGSEELTHAFTTQSNGSFAPEECANAQLRFEDNSFGLPDCRAYELVSPVDKNGGQVQGFGGNSGGGVLQAAADGNAVTYSSSASFGEGAQGAPTASQYISRRGEAQAGWSTENITTPSVSGSYGNANEGVPYQLFSTDLSAGLLLNGRHCRGSGTQCPIANPPLSGSGAPAGYQDYYLRSNPSGAFQSILAEADLSHTALSASKFSLSLAGATPGLTHVVLSTCAALTADAPAEQPLCESGGPNLYEWSGGALRLVNLLGADTHGTPDAHLAAQSGAISTDGSRVYFTDGEEAFLYLREGEAGAKLVSSDPAVSFQTASADGSIAFYIKGGELFRYDALADASEPIATEVEGVLGASTDGSRVYYSTPHGLFLWQAPGAVTEVASGPAAAQPSDSPPTTGTARVSADGAHLAFLSKASLTGYDNTDQHSKEADSELYLFSAGSGGGSLACISCNPTGARPLGPSTIPGASANGLQPGATQAYKPRDLSANAKRLFFDSADQILPEDGSTAPDVYQWEAQGEGSCQISSGCLSLISSGKSAEASSFVDASADGSDAFFLTGDSLLPRDPGSRDLYDARVLGGEPEPEKPTPCDGDSCQAVPSPPEDPAPGTIVAGQANPPVSFPKIPCKKGQVRKQGKCVEKPSHKHAKKHHGHRGGHK
jgi:hypothetical protein